MSRAVKVTRGNVVRGKVARGYVAARYCWRGSVARGNVRAVVSCYAIMQNNPSLIRVKIDKF